ncbi:MAG: hypothetical protein ABIT71_26600 [Vicinamibacteraceae bacterium]
MLPRVTALVLVVLLSGVPAAFAAQAAYVITTQDAPLFIGMDDRGTPLRVAKADSRLKVLKEEGDWVLVEFEDPQWGRRQGYVRVSLVEREAQVPVDVSVRDAPVTPIADAGARAAQAMGGEPERRGMPAGLKWSGIGLLIGGGATLGIGAALQDDDCYDFDYYSCDELRQGFYVFGGILAGTGLALLAIGAAKGGAPRTSIGMTHGRFLLQHRVAF